MNTREEILNIIEKNSRIDVHELSVLLGAEEILVAGELKALEEEGVICGYHTIFNIDNYCEVRNIFFVFTCRLGWALRGVSDETL